MNRADILIEEAIKTGNTRFEDERQLTRFIDEVLAIHVHMMEHKKIDRKLRRRIKKVFSTGLTKDIYQMVGLRNGLEAKHIEHICN